MSPLGTGGLFFVLGLLLQYGWVLLQRRLRVTQKQKSYGVGLDLEVKGSTPSMGGVVFVFLAAAAMVMEGTQDGVLFWTLPIACGLVGLIDDGFKFFRKSSEGLSSLRKLGAQCCVATIWAAWAAYRGTLGLWPGLDVSCGLLVPLAVLFTVGMMNAVNVTDGLDGLAGGAFMISLAVLGYLLPGSRSNAAALAALLGMSASFMLLNTHPASVFMGDSGSHFLGGALAALCLQNGRLLALIPAGFLFGIELLSSALQIAAIRGFQRKIFKMAPLHHHFQRSGWGETTVTFRFLLVHAVGASWFAALCVHLWDR